MSLFLKFSVDLDDDLVITLLVLGAFLELAEVVMTLKGEESTGLKSSPGSLELLSTIISWSVFQFYF